MALTTSFTLGFQLVSVPSAATAAARFLGVPPTVEKYPPRYTFVPEIDRELT